MTDTVGAPPPKTFRLSMLIYDARYRSSTIQLVVLIGALILVGWLISNTAQNLADLGKGVSFQFLSEPAGYDINQRLIAYHFQDTHLRAALVGVLNTLLVAVLGCALATVAGVLIGVLRLSKNWLVARIMSVYVEVFRNAPVLLWIVLVMAIMTEALPQPSAFRGEAPEASMLFDSVAITNRGVYIPEPVFARGLGNLDLFGDTALRVSLSLDLLAVVLAVLAGVWGARQIARRADRIQEETGDRPTTWYLRLAVAFLPVAALLTALGFHVELPELKGFNFSGGIHLRNSLIALWLALGLYTSAFIAEIVRGGILAISRGQTEAASALGLRPNIIMRLVILPQALRVIIPPLISQYLSLTKNSSLAIAVGYMDVTGTLMGISMNQTGRELETVMLGMLVYLTISLIISAVMNWYNNRVKLVER
jgi:general L-amino acid transport system permease protein